MWVRCLKRGRQSDCLKADEAGDMQRIDNPAAIAVDFADLTNRTHALTAMLGSQPQYTI